MNGRKLIEPYTHSHIFHIFISIPPPSPPRPFENIQLYLYLHPQSDILYRMSLVEYNSWQIQSIFSFIYCCKAFNLASISEISTDLFRELSCVFPPTKQKELYIDVQRFNDTKLNFFVVL